MFGCYRFLLASVVVVRHLGGFLPESGGYAVFSFYLLSGYLMALILNKTYGFSARGITRFLANRFLRIYPSYYLVLFVALPIVIFIPQAPFVNTALRLPAGWMEWTHNLVIFGLMNDRGRLVPPAWSLYIELVYYIAMPLLLARNRRNTCLWFGASLLYTIYLLASAASFHDRYYPPLAASLPFSLGALVYYFGDRLQMRSPWHTLLAPTLYLANLVLSPYLWRDPLDARLGFYVQLLLAAYWTAVLARTRNPSARFRQADRFLGNLAYPVFLCHYHIAVVFWWLTDIDRRFLLVCSYPLILITAFIIHAILESSLQATRNRIRQGSMERKPSVACATVTVL